MEELELSLACRICLGRKGETDIFCSADTTYSQNLLSYAEILVFCFALEVSKDDSLPNKLCRKCRARLLSAYKLKKLAFTTHSKFVKLLVSKDEPVVDFIKREKYEIDYIDNPLDVKLNIGSGSGDDKFEVKISQICSDDDDTKENIHIDSNDPVKTEHSAAKNDCKVNKKKIHLKSEPPSDSHICEHCGKQVKNMKSHLICHSENRRRFPCQDCDKTFMTYKAKKNHRAVHHLGLSYYCEICEKKYSSGAEHIRLRHSTKPKPYVCIFCGRSYYSASSLSQHVTIHTDIREHECPVCEKAFRNKYAVEKHKKRVHDGERPHICQFCSKAFFTSHHLQVHLRIHTKDKPYQCSKCEKRFSTSGSMKCHEKIHKGEKNFHCEYCEMSFYNNGALKTHLISHTKEKKYLCKYCGMKFGRSDHQKRHQKTAHENELYRPP